MINLTQINPSSYRIEITPTTVLLDKITHVEVYDAVRGYARVNLTTGAALVVTQSKETVDVLMEAERVRVERESVGSTVRKVMMELLREQQREDWSDVAGAI